MFVLAAIANKIQENKKKEMRFSIILDTLARLPYLSVESQYGYIYNNTIPVFCDYPDNDEAQKHLGKIQQECKVCALGSLLLSHISLNDNCSIKKISGFNGYGLGPVMSSRTVVEKQLSQFFSIKQLGMIEIAFEVLRDSYLIEDRTISKNEELALCKFGEKYDNPKERLGQILLNMLLHDTIFTP